MVERLGIFLLCELSSGPEGIRRHVEYFICELGRGRTRLARNEGIHFFADDIGVATNSTGEEFGGLKNWRADFAEAECAENFVGGLLYAIPAGGFWVEQSAAAFSRFLFR